MGKRETIIISLIIIVLTAIAFSALLNSENRRKKDQEKSILKVPSFMYGGSAIAAIDWNKDGHIDILATDRHGNIYVYLNDVNGHFAKKVESILKVPSRNMYRGSAIAAIDWNKDGHIDILATDGSGNIYVYLNDGNGHFVKN